MKPLLPCLSLACTVVLAAPLFAQAPAAPATTPASATPPAAAPATAASQAAAQPAEPARPALPDTLMDGTPVSMRLAETISSAGAHVGQHVPFEVTEDVFVQGVTVHLNADLNSAR